MAQKAIITQAEFEELRYRLGLMASSLSFHANDDLSNAHGINIVITPSTDGNGNPTDKYYDQYGNVVGPFHVGLVVNNTKYYAPGQVTTLEGNAPTTGITEVNDGQFRGVADSAWITQFTTPLTQDINLLIEQQLIPHTLLAHWEAHGGLSVVPEPVFNSAGIPVANNVIRMAVNGIVYKIPVHTRKGGPQQGWKDFRFSTKIAVIPSAVDAYKNNVVQSYRDDSQPAKLYYVDGSGALPRTVELQINYNVDGSSSEWFTYPGNVQTDFTTLAVGSSGGEKCRVNAYEITYPAAPSPNQFFQLHSFVGSSSLRRIGVLRVKITAAAGTDNIVRYSRWIQFYGADEDGDDNDLNTSFNPGLFGANEYGPVVT